MYSLTPTFYDGIKTLKSERHHSETRNALVQKLYDARAPIYDDSYHPSFAKKMLSFVNDPPLSPGNRVLDLCCGTGLCTFLISQQIAPGGHVYAIDISDGMLNVARKKREHLTSEQKDCVHIINHSAEDLHGIGELRGMETTFDLITCASALVLLSDASAAIRQWAEFLKQHVGRLILDVPYQNNWIGGVVLEEVARKMGKDFPSHRTWVKGQESVRAMLTRCSDKLEVEKIEFVEQQGWKRRFYDSDRQAAEKVLDDALKGNFIGPWAASFDGETMSMMRELFYEEWAKCADDHGKVEEVDGTWVAVLKRA